MGTLGVMMAKFDAVADRMGDEMKAKALGARRQPAASWQQVLPALDVSISDHQEDYALVTELMDAAFASKETVRGIETVFSDLAMMAGFAVDGARDGEEPDVPEAAEHIDSDTDAGGARGGGHGGERGRGRTQPSGRERAPPGSGVKRKRGPEHTQTVPTIDEDLGDGEAVDPAR